MRVPAYFFNFKCIADRCRHSCCVGWEIDVDERTLTRYRALDSGMGEAIAESIEETADGAHFRLCADERCPHLDEKGLCRIISTLGEGYLCDICRAHPRFYNAVGGVWECGLGAACEEAARLILRAPNYADFAEIADGEGALPPETVSEFDAFAHRAALYDALQQGALPLAARLADIEQKYGLGVALSPTKHRALFEALEYLDEAHRALFADAYCADFAPVSALSAACERFFAYLVFRHASPAADAGEFAAAVSLSHLLTRLFYALAAQGVPAEECARVISEELEYSEDNTAAICAVLNKGKGA